MDHRHNILIKEATAPPGKRDWKLVLDRVDLNVPELFRYVILNAEESVDDKAEGGELAGPFLQQEIKKNY